MNLVFEFTKTGNLIYISHLDLSRLFLRVLRMEGLRPAYSHGFNPHPKMSLALPLPLGVHSVCELLEFETGEPGSIQKAAEAVERVNGRLPAGARVTKWWEKPEELSKSLASYVTASGYEFMCEGIKSAPFLLEAFFQRKDIVVKKRDKKTGEESEKEIRSDMIGYNVIKDMRGRMLAEVTLSALPGRTLNPFVFFGAFCEASGLSKDELSPVITRTKIYDKKGQPLPETIDSYEVF